MHRVVRRDAHGLLFKERGGVLRGLERYTSDLALACVEYAERFEDIVHLVCVEEELERFCGAEHGAAFEKADTVLV